MGWHLQKNQLFLAEAQMTWFQVEVMGREKEVEEEEEKRERKYSVTSVNNFSGTNIRQILCSFT